MRGYTSFGGWPGGEPDFCGQKGERYISVTYLRDAIEHIVADDAREAINEFEDFVNDPSNYADVAPVRHGRPILKRGLGRCSECDGQTSLVWPYCPNCGAKMDGGEA